MAELIIKHFLDFRRTINELQRYSVRGKIDSILFTLSEVNNKELVSTLKEKRFNDMRKWVIANIDKEPTSMFRNVYEVLHKTLTLNQYLNLFLLSQVISTRNQILSRDQEINMVACQLRWQIVSLSKTYELKDYLNSINFT